MKLFKSIWTMPIFVFAILLVSSIFTFAQDAQVPIPQCSADMDFFQCLGLSIGSFHGGSTLVIVAVVVQLLLKFMNAPFFDQLFSKLDGWVKLSIISFLTIAGSVAGLMYGSNMSFLSALTSGAILTSVMVFANQIYQHFVAPKA